MNINQVQVFCQTVQRSFGRSAKRANVIFVSRVNQETDQIPSSKSRRYGPRTYPQPCGVTTPKKQSSGDLSTTISLVMGVMTTQALASEAQRARTKAAFIFIFPS